MPKFSIITISRNDKKGLEKTIMSVICQSFTDYEYIVIDGGSMDGSKDIIKKYVTHITYWVSEPDKGIYNAMNKGVLHAHGDYCIFMNSGDILYNQDVLKKIYERDYQEDIITGVTIGEDESDIRFNTNGEVTFLTLYRDTISHQSSFIKTKLLRKYPYNENLKIVSDWEFWIKAIILDNCSHIFDNNIVSKIDLNGISISNSTKRESERQLVLEKLIPQRILNDFYPLRYTDDTIIKYIAKISKTYRLHKIAVLIMRTLYKLSK